MDGHNVNTLKGYELGAGATIVDTPHGPFQRIKLSISLIDGEGEAVMPSAKVTAGIIFKKAPDDKPGRESLVALDLDSLALTTIEHQSKSKRINTDCQSPFPTRYGWSSVIRTERALYCN